MSNSIEFVKGHCGWDVVTLIPDGQVLITEELAAAVKILGAPLYGGLEVGYLGRGERAAEIRLRMVNSTTRDWIPMCGGMTQVIGKALVETFLRDRFDIDISRPVVIVSLMTPAGRIPIRIDIESGKAVRVTTIMDRYASFVYESGIELSRVRNVTVYRVGKYAVMDVIALEKRHPGVDFTRRDAGPHLEIVNDVLRAFGQRAGLRGVNGMLFDARPEGPGQYRVFPRFCSDDFTAARIPWEFQCGTGSIAVAMVLAWEGRLPFTSGAGEMVLEWGSQRTTPDPYGIRTSRLQIELNDKRVAKVSFSHSLVEILTEGKLTLPGYE